jgi:hypothetical protein
VRIHSVHERALPAPAAVVGALVDSLASDDDRLWPRAHWPSLRLDRPLSVGAEGRRAFLGERVVEYRAGERLVFELVAPVGLDARHRFEVEPLDDGHAILRHVVEGRSRGKVVLTWPLAIGPLHDALLEDLLDRAQAELGGQPERHEWSRRVRALRWAYRKRKGGG